MSPPSATLDDFLLTLDPLADLPPLPLLPSSPHSQSSAPISDLSDLSTAPSLPFSSNQVPAAGPTPGPASGPTAPTSSELSARLSASQSENKALRARVAALSRDNRALRVELRKRDPNKAKNSWVETLSEAVTVGPRKRSRTSGPRTTMACVILFAGAMFVSPSLLRGDRENATSAGATAIAFSRNSDLAPVEVRQPFTPLRRAALPPPGMEANDAQVGNDRPSITALRVHGALEKNGWRDGVDYMLCEDGVKTKDTLHRCAARTARRGSCLPPAGAAQMVSLVVPAGAAGLNLTGDVGDELAEVRCQVVSVGPLGAGRARRLRESGNHFGWDESGGREKAIIRAGEREKGTFGRIAAAALETAVGAA